MRNQRLAFQRPETTSSRNEILARWEARKAEWGRLHVQVDGEAVAEQVLSDIEALLSARDEQVLTLTAASKISGYSVDHLSRLVRAGTIRNAGRKSAPRIARHDLPLRPLRLVTDDTKAYDVASDARSLRARR